MIQQIQGIMEVFFLCGRCPDFFSWRRLLLPAWRRHIITTSFVAIPLPALTTWNFNVLASKKNYYSFKKSTLMKRWHCIVCKFFLLFILNISNRWWRQCIEASEEIIYLKDKLTLKTAFCYNYRLFISLF